MAHKSFDVHPLVEKLAARLLERGETLSCAESCTGGLLSACLTDYSGISSVFVGTVVAYSNSVKENELEVPFHLLKSVGAVSLPVARQMAVSIRTSLKSTWALSITGIAGPSGGTPQKPVGTVCFGLCGPGVERAEQELFKGSRREVREAAVEHALQLLLAELDRD